MAEVKELRVYPVVKQCIACENYGKFVLYDDRLPEELCPACHGLGYTYTYSYETHRQRRKKKEDTDVTKNSR